MTSKPQRWVRRPRRLALAGGGTFIATLALIGAYARPAQALRNDGLIVFESDRGGQSDIWVMEADGSNPRNLTNDKVDDVFPAWSPDGKRIAWTRGGRGPEGEIWVMNADGSGKTQVTFNGFSDFNATWSPDGREIAFRSLRGGNRDIYAIRVDGTGERRLTDDPASDFAPDWSPDGTRIAFTSLRSGASAIYSMNPDGSDVRKLTADTQQAALPGWSVAGDKIVYSDGFCDVCGESDLFIMNPDGSGVTQITDTPENELAKSLSRDGTRVVADFSLLSPSGSHLSKGDIAVIEVATGATVNLTNTPGINEEHPDWSPVGRPTSAAAASDQPASVVDAGAGRGARVWLDAGQRTLTVFYSLPRSGPVRLRIFDVRGREVECLVNSWQGAGTHATPLAARGRASQTYVYRLEYAGASSSGKLTVVR